MLVFLFIFVQMWDFGQINLTDSCCEEELEELML